MAKTDYKSIDEYHKAFTGDTLKRMQSIRQLVHKVAPLAEEIISYQIPAFKMDEKYRLIYYCGFPKHLTISSVWSEAFLKEIEVDLKGMKVSKSAIQFPHDKPLPLNLIKKILEFRKGEFDKKK